MIRDALVGMSMVFLFLFLNLSFSIAQDSVSVKGGDALIEDYAGRSFDGSVKSLLEIADTIVVLEDNLTSNTTWAIAKIEFVPQKDITVYELSLVIKCFMENHNYCHSPPKETKRHFQETVICAGQECKEMGY